MSNYYCHCKCNCKKVLDDGTLICDACAAEIWKGSREHNPRQHKDFIELAADTRGILAALRGQEFDVPGSKP